MRGQEKGPGYTQTEVILGESMQKFGRELGEESSFGELRLSKRRLLLPRMNEAGTRDSLAGVQVYF